MGTEADRDLTLWQVDALMGAARNPAGDHVGVLVTLIEVSRCATGRDAA